MSLSDKLPQSLFPAQFFCTYSSYSNRHRYTVLRSSYVHLHSLAGHRDLVHSQCILVASLSTSGLLAVSLLPPLDSSDVVSTAGSCFNMGHDCVVELYIPLPSLDWPDIVSTPGRGRCVRRYVINVFVFILDLHVALKTEWMSAVD